MIEASGITKPMGKHGRAYHCTLQCKWGSFWVKQDTKNTRKLPEPSLTPGFSVPELDSIFLRQCTRRDGKSRTACQHLLHKIREHFANALLDTATCLWIRPIRAKKMAIFFPLQRKYLPFCQWEGEECVNLSQRSSWNLVTLFRCSCQRVSSRISWEK